MTGPFGKRGLLLTILLASAVEARAAIVTLSRSEACPGQEVLITGSGWLEPPPSCFYTFLFDTQIGTFVSVAPNQPDGLFGPPNSSFVVPADAQVGPHTVKVQLYLDTGEFLQEATQPLTVVGVTFEGASDCAKTDGGFDSTAQTADQPWLSAVIKRTVKNAVAKVKPPSASGDMEFRSSDEAVFTVKPPKATGESTTLKVKGVAAGSAKVEAFMEEDGAEAVCGELNVVVYKAKTVKVAMHIVQLDGCPKPKAKVSAKKIEKAMEKMWDQAGIDFKVTVDTRTGTKAIKAADADADCKADEVAGDPPSGAVTFGPELMAIHDAAKAASTDVDVYFVQDYQYPFGAYHTAPKAIFVMALEDQAAGTTLATDLLVAHELGHHLDLAHCDGDTNCHDLGIDDLMHSANEGCRMYKSQWDTSNAKAGP